ncbi:agmatine deiminase family protein [Roseiconus nitratireducens]|uniref:Agmatine deiminase family protein n=1 Tax=Roseiconus nitratireducens TaxID=2605748 RepID=A0A5M6D7F6_9BACT|nr:agmatine deiminase family protein [Roseiconus nitratireducens]
MPAEWEPQRAVWIAWPHSLETWPGHFDPIPDVFRRFINAIAQSLPVHVIGPSEYRSVARIEQLPNVRWFDVPTNDSWIRDYGPTFVFGDPGATSDGDDLAIDWRFNAWGGKYPPWDDDDQATKSVIELAGWRGVEGGLCLEGGALEWDGTGRLLTTTDCLVTPTRNPGWSKQQIADRLADLTGTREIVWVDGGGLVGDDTDGHIDQLARFVDPQNVVVAVCEDPEDPNHDGLWANHRLLQQWGQTTSPRVAVHPLPIPPPRSVDSTRVPESYCNFLRLGPERLLVPSFGNRRSDQAAVGLLTDLAQQATPGVQVTTVDSRDLVWGLGALHCASLNEPLRSTATGG